MSTKKWIISCKEKEHSIVLNTGANIRDSMSLVMDGKVIAQLTIPSSSIIAKLEYSFMCEDEPVKIVVFGNNADLVFQETYQSSKKPYTPNYSMGMVFTIALIVINLLAPVVSVGSVISIVTAFACIVLSWVFSITPFLTKKEKLIRSALIVLLNFGIAIMSLFVGL